MPTSLNPITQNDKIIATAVENNFNFLLTNFQSATAPSNPSNGQLWYDSTNSLLKVYNLGTTTWLTVGPASSSTSVTVADTPPVSPSAGDLWFDTGTTLRLYVYTTASGGAWLDANPAAAGVTVPTGSVFYLVSATVPNGYLEANGATVSRTTYSALWQTLGSPNTGDGSTTFTLPDLRGEFIRGWDHSRGIDTGRILGSSQGFAIQNITGSLETVGNQPAAPFGSTAVGALYADNFTNSGGSGGGGTASNSGRLNFDASRIAATSTETRPRNVALMPIIKY